MKVETRQPLRWQTIVRPDGVEIEQALARNNSWYLIVPAENDLELRYASQAGNYLVARCASPDEAKRAADAHADRYDTRV
jgi:hypothetical protein